MNDMQHRLNHALDRLARLRSGVAKLRAAQKRAICKACYSTRDDTQTARSFEVYVDDLLAEIDREEADTRAAEHDDALQEEISRFHSEGGNNHP